MSTRVPRASDLGLSLADVLGRVADESKAKNDSGVAAALGVGRSSLPTWRKADTLPFEPLFAFAKARNLSMDWLLTGQGRKHLDPSAVDAQQLMIRDSVLGDKKAARARSSAQANPPELPEKWIGVCEPARKDAYQILSLERMQDCIQVLAELAEKQGRKLKPEKFARACVLLYEMSSSGGPPLGAVSVQRLLETID